MSNGNMWDSSKEVLPKANNATEIKLNVYFNTQIKPDKGQNGRFCRITGQIFRLSRRWHSNIVILHKTILDRRY